MSIYKPINSKDVVTVKTSTTADVAFYSTIASASSLTVSTLTSITALVVSSQIKVITAYKESSPSFTGENKNFYNHVVNYFYGQNPASNFNPNLNFTDSVFPRQANLSSLTSFSILAIDRGVMKDSIVVSSFTAAVNGTVLKDGNAQTFNNFKRGAIYVGSTGVGDIFYDYGIAVLYGNYAGTSAFQNNLNINFQLNTSTTAHSISSVFIKAQEEFIKKRVFVRLYNYEFNYTNNETAVDSNGIYLPKILDEPFTYISEVALHSYRDGVLEEVAIAKLSSPVKKNFDNEYNFQFDILPIF